MYIDQTNIFRTIVHDKVGHDITSGNPAQSSSTVDSSQESSRAASPTGLRNRFGVKKDGLKRRRRKVSREVEMEENARRDFLAEAYRIVSGSFMVMRPLADWSQHKQLSELTAHLRLIRRAYLSTAPPPLPSRQRQQPLPNSADMDPERARLRYLEQSKHLSDREKDEVDVRARLIIKTCRDRVELLERREKRMYRV
jgi:hypothetical protein